MEVLPPETVSDIVIALFPADRSPRDDGVSFIWQDDLAVTAEEVMEAGARVKTGKAPGPDGIAGCVVKGTVGHLAPMWAGCLTDCLKVGHFPRQWKRARLVLIKKPGKPDLSPSSYRHICLLSEARKLFKRVIARRRRLHAFLDETGDIADGQFGFRERRSTVDAIWSLRERVDESLRDRGVVVAVSLDINANVFNSLPWSVIRGALEDKNVPGYLRCILDEYLSDRELSFVDRRDRLVHKPVSCGVPQSSVLGPIL